MNIAILIVFKTSKKCHCTLLKLISIIKTTRESSLYLCKHIEIGGSCLNCHESQNWLYNHSIPFLVCLAWLEGSFQ